MISGIGDPLYLVSAELQIPHGVSVSRHADPTAVINEPKN